MVPKLPGILEKLAHPQAAAALARLRGGHRLGKAYVDRTKLTDHHAIIPTGQQPAPNLAPDLQKVYDLVVARFVGIFLPDQVVEETTVLLDIGGAVFVAKGSVVLEAGWTVVQPAPAKAEPAPAKAGDDQRQALPPLQQGQQVHVTRMDVVEKETQPPRPYNDATLLAAMKNAGREIEDDELAAAMKESGLGTPATRAETIEKLIRTDYVVRDRKAITSTEKGKALVGLVAEPLRSPELTAEWEQQLKEVEEGQRPVAGFYEGIADLVKTLVPKVQQGPALSPEQAAQAQGKKTGKGKGRGKVLGPCPKCKEGQVVENAKGYGCSRYREGCNLTIWKTVARKKLTEKQAQLLMANGRTEKMQGFISKAGKKFEARLKFDDEFKVVFEFDDQPRNGSARSERREEPPRETAQSAALTCPKCQQGQIIEGQRGFGCNRYRQGCDFVVWKEMAGKKLTEKQIHTLIAKGKTGIIKGFKSKKGSKFDARLKLGPECKAAFDFPADAR